MEKLERELPIKKETKGKAVENKIVVQERVSNQMFFENK